MSQSPDSPASSASSTASTSSLPALRFTAPDGTPFPNWQTKKLGEVVNHHKGGAPLKPSDFVDYSSTKVISKKSVQLGGYLKFQDSQTFCKNEFWDKHLNSVVTSDYVIVVLRDLVPSGPSIGYAVQYYGSQKYILAQGVYGLKLNLNECIKAFLTMYSNTSNYRKKMQEIMVGSTQVHIRNGDYFNLSIPLPSLAEQEKIATALTAVDDKITALKDKTAHYEAFKKGLMQRVFPQP